MNKTIKGCLIILTTTLVCGLLVKGSFAHKANDSQSANVAPVSVKRNKQGNRHAIDSAISLLKSGYVVLRAGLGADSYMLMQMNRKDKSYSHCGIVMMEHGYPFVYHSIGGEDNPDERLRRDSAQFFFSPYNNSGIAILRYDLSEQQTSRLRNVVDSFYKARPRFDLHFSLQSNDELYCSEFVYKALTAATSDAEYIKPTTVMGFSFVGIDDLFVNPHARFVWRLKFK